jgi:hypothetical protein
VPSEADLAGSLGSAGITGDRMSEWRKSSRSGSQGGNCVEVRRGLGGLRDSKNQSGPVLSVDVAALVADVRSGRIG